VPAVGLCKKHANVSAHDARKIPESRKIPSGRMNAPSFDLVVIGSGPAGEKGAAQAAYFGRRVALVEKEPHLGGAGVNTGTIPSKTLRETALYFSGLRQRGLFGIDYRINKTVT